MSWLWPTPSQDPTLTKRLNDAKARQTEALKKNSDAARGAAKQADAVRITLEEMFSRMHGDERIPDRREHLS
jgi:hypothetical protein